MLQTVDPNSNNSLQNTKKQAVRDLSCNAIKIYLWIVVKTKGPYWIESFALTMMLQSYGSGGCPSDPELR